MPFIYIEFKFYQSFFYCHTSYSSRLRSRVALLSGPCLLLPSDTYPARLARLARPARPARLARPARPIKLPSSNPKIYEASFFKLCRIINIPAIKDYFSIHKISYGVEVRKTEFRPFSHQRHSICTP